MVNELPLLLSLANFLPKIPENHWASSRARKSLVMDTRAKIVLSPDLCSSCMHGKANNQIKFKAELWQPKVLPCP